MTTRKRNEWLDAGSGEEDDLGDESEVEQSKGRALTGRNSKRQKVDDEDRSEEISADDYDDFDTRLDRIKPLPPTQDTGAADDRETSIAVPTSLKALTPKQLAASQKRVSRTGVIYISRVPPFMKPQTVKHLLTPHGTIGRIFLTPEDPAAHTRRVKSGGNKKRSFTDGWVEFMNKTDAKRAAETLNASIIGGKKGGWYHDDVWNMKYLKGFKWHHLTEQIANENAVRTARMRAEIAQTSRENKAFIKNVERAKMIEGIKEKRKRKLGKMGEEQGKGEVGERVLAKDREGDEDRFRHHFRQNVAKSKVPVHDRAGQSDDVKRVLSKIF